MIKVVESPQYSDSNKISWVIDNDTITITMNGKSEVFDFTGMPEGEVVDMEVEELEFNPIGRAEKIGEEIRLTILRFYGTEEKEVFESGKDNLEIPFGIGL